jgi:hypothetical protein
LINAAPCNFTVSPIKLQAAVYAAAISSPDALVRAATTATSSPPLADRSRGWSNGAHLVHTFDFFQSMPSMMCSPSAAHRVARLIRTS